MKKISLVITAYNEQENVIELHKQICSTIQDIEEYQFEILFIENGSHDSTFSNLKKYKRLIKE